MRKFFYSLIFLGTAGVVSTALACEAPAGLCTNGVYCMTFCNETSSPIVLTVGSHEWIDTPIQFTSGSNTSTQTSYTLPAGSSSNPTSVTANYKIHYPHPSDCVFDNHTGHLSICINSSSCATYAQASYALENKVGHSGCVNQGSTYSLTQSSQSSMRIQEEGNTYTITSP
ncbi:MAG TPA: hypothetical protein VJB02_01270 [Coxiellaceae bacterium]|nr:hypothetical protein [Coxiellaceae bacterium]